MALTREFNWPVWLGAGVVGVLLAVGVWAVFSPQTTPAVSEHAPPLPAKALPQQTRAKNSPQLERPAANSARADDIADDIAGNDPKEQATPPSSETIRLANGLSVESRVASGSELLGGDYTVFDIVAVEPGSGWAEAGLSAGDIILTVEGQRFDDLSAKERIELLEDPEAEFGLSVHPEEGTTVGVTTSLTAALEYGIRGVSD